MLDGRSGGGAENQLPSQEILVLPKAFARPSMLVPEAMIPRLVFRPGAVPPEGLSPPPVVGAVEAVAAAALLAGAEDTGAAAAVLVGAKPVEESAEPESPDPAANEGLAEGVVGVETESGSSVGFSAEPCVPVPDVVAAAAASAAWTVTVTVGLVVTVTVPAAQAAPLAESESVPEPEPALLLSALAAPVSVSESESELESDPVFELAASASVPVDGVWVSPSALVKVTVSVASAFTVWTTPAPRMAPVAEGFAVPV